MHPYSGLDAEINIVILISLFCLTIALLPILCNETEKYQRRYSFVLTLAVIGMLIIRVIEIWYQSVWYRDCVIKGPLYGHWLFHNELMIMLTVGTAYATLLYYILFIKFAESNLNRFTTHAILGFIALLTSTMWVTGGVIA
jgi:hypothetical protein